MKGREGSRGRWLRWVVLAVGRALHLLGFRWRFLWTLPFPYHPLLALLLPFVPLVLVGWAGFELVQGGRSPVHWFTLLLAGLLLVIPLSVPVLNAIAFAFRVPLLQGFCFLGAMILLAAEVANGSRPLAHGLLPAAYFLLFLVQRIGGPIRLRQLRRASEAFAPVQAGNCLVRLTIPGRGEAPLRQAQRLMREKGLAEVAVRSASWVRRGCLLLRPSDKARQLLRELVPPKALRATAEGLRIDGIDVGRLKPEVDVRLRVGGDWLLKGRLILLTLTSGGERRRLASGEVAPVGNWPLFILLYDFALFSGGTRKGQWHAGFAPGKAEKLEGGGEQQLLDRAFTGAEPWAEVGPEALRQTLEPLCKHLERRARSEARARQQRLITVAAEIQPFLSGRKSSLKLLTVDFAERPELLRGTGPAACQALAAAKDKGDRVAARIAANLLAALPIDEFVTLEEELLPLLGSRVLALDWQITPELDLSPLPRDCPRWGEIAGFGLMKAAPELWARMGELGPRFARMTALFIKEVGERPMLVAARERFAERGIRLPDV